MFSHTKPTRAGRIAAAALPILMVCGLAACSTTADPGSQVLVVQAQAGDEVIIDAFTAAFNKKYPNVEVKQQAVSVEAKNGSNIQVITGSNPPDVAVVPTNSEVYTNLVKGSQLVDLQGVYDNADLVKRYGATLANSLSINGQFLIAPYDAYYYNMVFYNKEVFSQLGIPEPTDHRIGSYDELKSMVAALKAGGVDGLGVGPTDNYQMGWMLDAFLPTVASDDELAGFLGSWKSADGPSTDFSASPFVQSIAQIRQMGADGIFQEGYLGQTVPQAQALFVAGKLGMFLMGSSTPANMQRDGIDFDYDWALLPPIGTARKAQVTNYFGSALAIPVGSKNQDLAKAYIEAALSVEGQAGMIPNQLPIVNDVPSDAYTGLLPQVVSMLDDLAKNDSQPGWTSVVPASMGQVLVDPAIQEMLNGSGTPEEIAASVQKEYESVRSGS